MPDMQLFHPLHTELQPPRQFNNPFYYDPDPLCMLAFKDMQKILPPEPAEGKMFGILVCRYQGQIGYIKAYSGQMEAAEGWVPPAFDYLQSDGYFKTHEAEITAINHRIDELEHSEEYQELQRNYSLLLKEADENIKKKQGLMKAAKSARDKKRKAGGLSGKDLAEMKKESQFLKAEVHRTKLQYKARLEKCRTQTEDFRMRIHNLKMKRKLKSDALQNWLFEQFVFLNAKGESKNLIRIFQEYWQKNNSKLFLPDSDSGRLLPPSGAGECCEPKLLQYAFLHHMVPLCMAMFWWGPSPKAEIRHHQQFYPACNGKCKPILDWMLQGLDVASNPIENDKPQQLDIVYDDKDIVVVCKPAGMLSVPGKNNRESVLSILKQIYPDATGPMIVHRLDMATSGLLVVARNIPAYINLQKQFAKHTINKRYRSIIANPSSKISSIGQTGVISLPLAPDILDRPRQKVDYQNGKKAVTRYQVLDLKNNEAVIALWPETGRTHQLRVHCAHPDGLNAPIKGDELYGKKSDRLYLHAEYLEFTHPTTGERLHFERKAEW